MTGVGQLREVDDEMAEQSGPNVLAKYITST